MNNLEHILKLIFRRVAAHNVISGEILYNDFDQNEFERLYFTYDLVKTRLAIYGCIIRILLR